MVNKAIERIVLEKPKFEIYTVSIWTDPNAAVSSINFDSKRNSDKNVRRSNEWSKKYHDQFVAEGDLEQAKLFEPRTGRHCNPADFELRNFELINNPSIRVKDWEFQTNGRCWTTLQPVLKEIGAYAFKKLLKLNIHADFELSVNGKKDWYQFTWPQKRKASSDKGDRGMNNQKPYFPF